MNETVSCYCVLQLLHHVTIFIAYTECNKKKLIQQLSTCATQQFLKSLI